MRREPLGADYWKKLTDEQTFLAGALKEEFLSLRQVVNRQNADAARKIKGSVRWEKLYLLGILDVDRERRDNIYVRRGPKWQKWWDRSGVHVTSGQILCHEILDDIERLFADTSRD